MTVLAQLKREFTAFFFSPIAYVLLTVAAAVNGIIFLFLVDALTNPMSPPGAVMQFFFTNIFFWAVLFVLTPLITMRTIAEERHSGTIETLVTAPISDVQVVFAKYLASVAFFVVLWLPTAAFPLLLSRYTEIDLGPVLAGYLGTLCVGMMFLAIGVLCSALTRSQIIAALISFAAIMVLFVLGIFDFLSETEAPGSVLHYLNLWSHMEDFGRGIVDTRHLAYYGSVILFALFAAVQAVQARRWK